MGKVFYKANAGEGRRSSIASRAAITTTRNRRNNPIRCDLTNSPVPTIDKVNVPDTVRNRSLWTTNRGCKGVPTITAKCARAITGNG